MTKNIFAERLTELRKTNNLKREDIAEWLCCSTAAVANYENGNRSPDYDSLITLAKKFNTTTDYLLGLSGVQTTDADIKQVCGYTGLSMEVVEALHRNATVEQIHLTFPISEKININHLINNLFKE